MSSPIEYDYGEIADIERTGDADPPVSRFAMHPQLVCPVRDNAVYSDCDPKPDTDLYQLFSNVYALRWFHCEFFSSSIDQEIERSERKFIRHLVCAFPGFRRLWSRLGFLDLRNIERNRCEMKCPRLYWTIMRSLMGVPSSIHSPSFYSEERIQLSRRRWKFRLLQRKQVSEGFAHEFDDMPSELSVPLVVGTRVVAWLTPPNVVRCGFFPGTVSGVDYDSNTYRIIFDDRNIGTISVLDHEVASVDALMTYGKADYFIKYRHWKYRNQSSYKEAGFPGDAGDGNPDDGSGRPCQQHSDQSSDGGAGNGTDLPWEHDAENEGAYDGDNYDDLDVEILNESQLAVVPIAVFLRDLFEFKRAIKIVQKTHNALFKLTSSMAPEPQHKSKRTMPVLTCDVARDISTLNILKRRYADAINRMQSYSNSLSALKPFLVNYRNTVAVSCGLPAIKSPEQNAGECLRQAQSIIEACASTMENWIPDKSIRSVSQIISDNQSLSLINQLVAIFIHIQKYVESHTPTTDESIAGVARLNAIQKIFELVKSSSVTSSQTITVENVQQASIQLEIQALLKLISNDLQLDTRVPYMPKSRRWAALDSSPKIKPIPNL